MKDSPNSSNLPSPDVGSGDDAKPYWDAAAEGRLVLPRCHRCREVIWYPRTFCPACGSFEIEWFEANGRGTIYSFTVVRQTTGSYADVVPYVVAYVELEEGPRILTNVLSRSNPITIGQAVEGFFDRSPRGSRILRFRTT